MIVLLEEHAVRAQLPRRTDKLPANTRVFCVGVGNEVDRALLEQIAEEARGLAAFISRGDDFDRRARAFRRKLTRSVASNVRISFEGVRVYDVEPPTLANLYHGTPLRVLGRYAGGGPVKITITGDVRGATITQQAELDMPDVESDNTEIERMWAWHRIDRLLKEANRRASRDSVIDQIVRLGEGFSIASEYTSFIVLENDAEYQRWKIDRRNALRVGRDRAGQQRVQEQLSQLRRQASERLVPVLRAAPADDANAAGQPSPTAPPTAAVPRPRRGVDLNIGGNGAGALDPLTAVFLVGGGAALAAAGRRKRSR